jgi:tetratricopeptide (TPR) repeat protein
MNPAIAATATCFAHRRATWGAPVENAESAEPLAQIAFLTAALHRADRLPVLPANARAALSDAWVRIPLQASALGDSHPAGDWLQIAAWAEMQQCTDLAWELLEGITRHANGQAELLALCDCQRGRMLRVQGHLDEAAAFYEAAVRRTRTVVGSDVWARALSGWSNVYIDRGNYPAAERCLRRALGRPASVVTRTNLWMGLAIVRRNRGDAVDAMLCAWNAFDLTAPDTPLRADLLVSLAECASELGNWSAAAHGFEQAYRAAHTTRVRIAAAVGMVRARRRELEAGTAATRDGHGLSSAMAFLDAVLGESPGPHERALALLSRVETGLVLRTIHQASDPARLISALEEARVLSERHGFHEFRIRVDELERHLLAVGEPGDAVSAPAPRAGRTPRVLPAPLERLARYQPEAAHA